LTRHGWSHLARRLRRWRHRVGISKLLICVLVRGGLLCSIGLVLVQMRIVRRRVLVCALTLGLLWDQATIRTFRIDGRWAGGGGRGGSNSNSTTSDGRISWIATAWLQHHECSFRPETTIDTYDIRSFKSFASDKRMSPGLLWRPSLDGVQIQQPGHKVDKRRS
jgi:hypothetical protein